MVRVTANSSAAWQQQGNELRLASSKMEATRCNGMSAAPRSFRSTSKRDNGPRTHAQLRAQTGTKTFWQLRSPCAAATITASAMAKVSLLLDTMLQAGCQRARGREQARNGSLTNAVRIGHRGHRTCVTRHIVSTAQRVAPCLQRSQKWSRVCQSSCSCKLMVAMHDGVVQKGRPYGLGWP